jgi:hypothetical protein
MGSALHEVHQVAQADVSSPRTVAGSERRVGSLLALMRSGPEGRSSAALRRPARRGAAALAALVPLLLAIAPAAGAATPFSLGPGRLPDVAVTSTGSAAVIAYNGDEPIGVSTHVCRLSRGARACDRAVTLQSPGGDTVYRPHVFVTTPNAVTGNFTVRVLGFRYGTPQGDRDFLWTSGDSGETFGPPVAVGTFPLTGDAAFGPGNSISIVSAVSGMGSYQKVPLQGPPATSHITFPMSDAYGGAVAVVDGRLPLVAFAGLGETSYSVYSGNGSLYDAANWSRPHQVAAGGGRKATGENPHLTSAATNVLAVSDPDAHQLLLFEYLGREEWAFLGEDFTPQKLVSGSQTAIVQTPSGDLVYGWPEGDELTLWSASGGKVRDSSTACGSVSRGTTSAWPCGRRGRAPAGRARPKFTPPSWTGGRSSGSCCWAAGRSPPTPPGGSASTSGAPAPAPARARSSPRRGCRPPPQASPGARGREP